MSRAPQSSLSRTVLSWSLKISKDGDSTTSLGSLITCSREVFSLFTLNFMSFLIFNVCPLLLVPSVGTSEKTLDPSALFPPIRYLHTLIRPSQVVWFWCWVSQLSQPLLICQMLYHGALFFLPTPPPPLFLMKACSATSLLTQPVFVGCFHSTSTNP